MNDRSLLHLVLGLSWLALASCASETTEPNASPRSGPSLATTATALAFTQVSAGTWQGCGLTSGGQLYCWGPNSYGEVGDGTIAAHDSPTLVAGGLLFRQVSAGLDYTCSVTTDNRAYCWGDNAYGQLGDGTTVQRLTPVPVAGSHAFREISAGWDRTCALTTSPTNKIYCWGHGILGDGNAFTNHQRTPKLISGGRTYRQVAVGTDHTCGVSTSYKVLCWGKNKYGQLGNGAGSSYIALNPVLVAGTLQYLQVSAGSWHTCAVTTTNRAYCWGRQGTIGDGMNYRRSTPRAVAGGLSFDRISAGEQYTCAVTTGNRAYCWGANWSGQLGDSTDTARLTPSAVSGGLRFRQVDAGTAEHTCGVDTGSVAWCWGGNGLGQLGIGTEGGTYLSPTRVQ
jgi:alpha-tubulin suppressor-like RCC1 family protein